MAMRIKDFQCSSKLKQMKKAVYFTMDSIIAGGIVLIAIILTSSFYIEEQSNAQLDYLSQDLIGVLGGIAAKDIDNSYIKSLIDDGTITNADNTILEQIGEFWADSRTDLANKIASNVTDPFILENTGFGICINDEVIYERNIQIKKSLVSNKKIISGIAKGQTSLNTRQKPPTLWIATAEARVWQ